MTKGCFLDLDLCYVNVEQLNKLCVTKNSRAFLAATTAKYPSAIEFLTLSGIH